jgi:hypothetical protein
MGHASAVGHVVRSSAWDVLGDALPHATACACKATRQNRYPSCVTSTASPSTMAVMTNGDLQTD